MVFKYLKTLGMTSDNSACAADGTTSIPTQLTILVLVTGTTVIEGAIEPILELVGAKAIFCGIRIAGLPGYLISSSSVRDFDVIWAGGVFFVESGIL